MALVPVGPVQPTTQPAGASTALNLSALEQVMTQYTAQQGRPRDPRLHRRLAAQASARQGRPGTPICIQIDEEGQRDVTSPGVLTIVEDAGQSATGAPSQINQPSTQDAGQSVMGVPSPMDQGSSKDEGQSATGAPRAQTPPPKPRCAGRGSPKTPKSQWGTRTIPPEQPRKPRLVFRGGRYFPQ